MNPVQSAASKAPGGAASLSVSIIVPVLNEGATMVGALDALAHFRLPGVEIVVVDGGSDDDTVALATPRCDRVLSAPRGRGSQMNAGAAASGGAVSIFLHVDTRLPEGAIEEVRGAMHSGAAWGRFDVTIEGRSRWFPIIAFMMNWRSRLSAIATGDQAIFVRREAFLTCGGYPDIPLMEDIALTRCLRRTSRPWCSRLKARTAGRRWEKHGVLRTIGTMWRLRLRYFLGADPQQLAKEYGYRPRSR